MIRDSRQGGLTWDERQEFGKVWDSLPDYIFTMFLCSCNGCTSNLVNE